MKVISTRCGKCSCSTSVCALPIQQSRLPLSSTRLKDVPDNAVIQNVFHVIGLNRTITLAAPTRKDKKDWMDSINAAILGLREVRSFSNCSQQLTRESTDHCT